MKKYMLMTAVIAAAACALYAQGAPASGKAAPAVIVEKIVTATGVQDREPVGETAAFVYGTGRVYTWTRITAESTPVKIKHVYFLEGKKVREAELEIKSSPYRVWSWKNVTPGNWRVAVISEDGSELADTEFTVAAEARQ